MATGLGVLLWVNPIVALGLAVAWAVLVKVTKVASIGSLVVVVAAIPLLIWQGEPRSALLWIGASLLLVVWRHKGNITRMMDGGDNKVVEA